MIVERLRIWEFRGQAELDLALEAGLTVLRGPNEAGKSTLVAALVAALFDAAAAPGRAPDDRPRAVELTVRAGDERFELRRDYAAGIDRLRESATGRATDDPAEIARRLTELIGCPSRAMFESTACVQHDELARLDKDAAALSTWLRRIVTGPHDGDVVAAVRQLERYRSELVDLDATTGQLPALRRRADELRQRAAALGSSPEQREDWREELAAILAERDARAAALAARSRQIAAHRAASESVAAAALPDRPNAGHDDAVRSDRTVGVADRIERPDQPGEPGARSERGREAGDPVERQGGAPGRDGDVARSDQPDASADRSEHQAAAGRDLDRPAERAEVDDRVEQPSGEHAAHDHDDLPAEHSATDRQGDAPGEHRDTDRQGDAPGERRATDGHDEPPAERRDTDRLGAAPGERRAADGHDEPPDGRRGRREQVARLAEELRAAEAALAGLRPLAEATEDTARLRALAAPEGRHSTRREARTVAPVSPGARALLPFGVVLILIGLAITIAIHLAGLILVALGLAGLAAFALSPRAPITADTARGRRGRPAAPDDAEVVAAQLGFASPAAALAALADLDRRRGVRDELAGRLRTLLGAEPTDEAIAAFLASAGDATTDDLVGQVTPAPIARADRLDATRARQHDSLPDTAGGGAIARHDAATAGVSVDVDRDTPVAGAAAGIDHAAATASRPVPIDHATATASRPVPIDHAAATASRPDLIDHDAATAGGAVVEGHAAAISSGSASIDRDAEATSSQPHAPHHLSAGGRAAPTGHPVDVVSDQPLARQDVAGAGDMVESSGEATTLGAASEAVSQASLWQDDPEAMAASAELAELTRRAAELRALLEPAGAAPEEADAAAEELAAAEEQLDVLERRLAAVDAALATIGDARDRTLETAASRVASSIGPRLAALTGRRYSRIAIDPATLAIAVAPREGDDWIAPDRLSRGTRDLVYLAARLALVEHGSAGGQSPLILDDPLVSFDDARAARMLELLRELAGDRQILLFTWSSRHDRFADHVVELPGPASDDAAGSG